MALSSLAGDPVLPRQRGRLFGQTWIVVLTRVQSNGDAAALLSDIHSGTICVHDTKKDVTLRALQMQLANIQTTLGLRTGSSGDWSVQAQEKLHAWLQRPRCGKCSSSYFKALQDGN